MDLKSQKLNFKSKVNNLIQQYDRQKAEEEEKKQQIKKQIMIEIIKNRQKNQTQQNKEKSGISTKQYTSKTENQEKLHSQTPTAYFQATFKQQKFKQNQIKIPSTNNSQLGLPTKQDKLQKYEGRLQKLEEITFNMNRRNKNIEDEINYKQFKYQPQIEQKKETAKMQLSVNKSEKNISKVSVNKQKQQYIQHAVEQKSSDQEQARPPPSTGKFSKYFKDSDIANERGSSYLNKQKEQPQKQEHLSDDEVEYLDPPHEEEQRGVFLTMEESESMTASDLPKNYAFQIKTDQLIGNQDMQEIKKQKIKEMERKRQQRIQEFRRSESQKKVEMPKGRNSYSKKPQKIQKDDRFEADLPPRSGTIQKKHQKSIKIQKQIPSRFIPLQSVAEPQQSQYNVRPPTKPYVNYSHNYQPNKVPINKQANDYHEDRESKPISPFKTPKTIQSENKGKSINKNTNIFQGDLQRQKSSSKILTEPKIQPKDRKNSFTKQSNKKLMINAITYVCFPGQLNRRERQKLIDVLQTSEYEFFIFLFKEYSRKIIKGIYVLDSSQSRLQKIYGQKAPAQVTADRVQEFYRFDSGSREFKKVDGCRSFSLSIHAIDMR